MPCQALHGHQQHTCSIAHPATGPAPGVRPGLLGRQRSRRGVGGERLVWLRAQQARAHRGGAGGGGSGVGLPCGQRGALPPGRVHPHQVCSDVRGALCLPCSSARGAQVHWPPSCLVAACPPPTRLVRVPCRSCTPGEPLQLLQLPYGGKDNLFFVLVNPVFEAPTKEVGGAAPSF